VEPLSQFTSEICKIGGAPAIWKFPGRVGAGVEQHSHRVFAATRRRKEERSPAVAIDGVHFCPGFYHEPHHRDVAKLRGCMERCASIAIRNAEVRARIQKSKGQRRAPHVDSHHNAFSLIALSEVYEASPTPPGQLIALTPPLGFFFAARSFTLISGFAFAGFFCLAMVLVIWVLFYYGLAKTTLTIIHASRLQHRICDRKDWHLTPRHILSLAAEYQIFTSIKNHQPRFRRFKHKAELLVHPIAIAWTHCVA
jgi:hypothetical protein